MKTNTRLQIIELIRKHRTMRPAEIMSALGMTGAAIHRHLKALTADLIIEKMGTAGLKLR